jgi:hypothetical protein
MILAARELPKDLDCTKFKRFHELLVDDEHFWMLSQHSTTSRKNVLSRMIYVKELYRNMPR